MGTLIKLVACKSFPNDDLYQSFKEVTQGLSGSAFFNPSFYFKEGLSIFSFRTMSLDTQKLESHFFIGEKNQKKHLNLSALYCDLLNERQLIDPKVFNIGTDVYLSYNSAWVYGGNNLYVQKIYPELKAPLKISYDKRQEQERNWTFYSKGNDIFALYGINPVKVLRLSRQNDSSWYFEDYYNGPENEDFSNELSLGTQFSFLNNKYYFMAHRKRLVFGKKLYYGKLCSFCPDTNMIKVAPGLYFHSYKGLLGASIKTNSNLFSCTYFSGIMALKDKILLSYGVNDVGFGFAEVGLLDF